MAAPAPRSAFTCRRMRPPASVSSSAMPNSYPMTASTQPADAVSHSCVEHLSPRLKPYAQLMRLDRPIGVWLLFWPCVFGLVLGAAAEDRLFNSWRDIALVLLFVV